MTDQPKSFLDGVKPYKPELTGEQIDFAHDMMENVSHAIRDSFQKQIRNIRSHDDFSKDQRHAVEWQFREYFQEKTGLSAYSPWINSGLGKELQ